MLCYDYFAVCPCLILAPMFLFLTKKKNTDTEDTTAMLLTEKIKSKGKKNSGFFFLKLALDDLS